MNREKGSVPYRSCYYLESGITFLPHELGFCCDRQSPATIQPIADVGKTVDAFLEARDRVIRENQRDTPPCSGCSLFQSCGRTDGKIQYINFGVHNYCQFACTYCALQGANAQDKNMPENYDALEIAKELKRRGLLSKSLHISCASGEISIHPKRNEYYDFIEENAATVDFSSNAGKFDVRLAHILSLNSKNALIVSIDCGTPETFQRVRGVDMFERVINNLVEYRKYSPSVLLKYILLDENCENKDLLGFIKICNDLKILRMIITGDLRKTWDYKKSMSYEEHIVSAAIKLVEGAIDNNIFISFFDHLGQPNLKEIHHRLLSIPSFVSAAKDLDHILSASQVICYGAGGNCETILGRMEKLGLRKPDVLWDIKGERPRGGEISAEQFGYPICYPDFEQLNDSSDVGMFITITNRAVNQNLAANMQGCGFKNVLTNDRLELALLAKQAEGYLK